MRNKLQKIVRIGLILGAGMFAGVPAQEVKAELVSGEYPRFGAGDIRSLTLTQDGEEIFRISQEPAAYKMEFDYWEILNPYDETATVDTEAMYQLFEKVAAMDFSEPVDMVPDAGIEAAETSLSVEFVDTSDSGGADSAKDREGRERSVTVLIGKEDGEGSVYAAVQGQEEQIYKLPAAAVAEIFHLKPFDYILKIPVLFNIGTLDHVEIAIGDKNYTMKRKDDTYFFGKEEVEKEKFTTLYQALMNVYLKSDFDSAQKDEKAAQKDELLLITFHRSVEDAPDAELSYSPFDDDYDSLAINGKKQFLVKAEDVDTLMELIQESF